MNEMIGIYLADILSRRPENGYPERALRQNRLVVLMQEFLAAVLTSRSKAGTGTDDTALEGAIIFERHDRRQGC